MSFCSPSHEKLYERDKTCFTKEALVRLVQAWNDANPAQPIAGYQRMSKNKLWQSLNTRMFSICKGSGREWCWVDKLQKSKQSKAVVKSLRPQTPREWYSKPYAWLSNFDIEAVMRQYQEDKANKFKFLGVYPLDFASKDMFGKCLYSEICALDITKLMKGRNNAVKFIGLITNLDYHDQDGSHWTSLFACIDPRLPCFGAYYYDSVAPSKPPSEMQSFMDRMKQQAEAYAKTVRGCENATFQIKNNTVRHQYGNSECGLFSMAFQIRWLDKLQKDPNGTRFEDIVNVRLKDEQVHSLRSVLFRPNTREIMQEKRKSTY